MTQSNHSKSLRTKTLSWDNAHAKNALLIGFCFLVVIAFLASNIVAYDVSLEVTPNPFGWAGNPQASQNLAAESTIMWRHTAEGWQDISSYYHPAVQTSQPLNHVHPLVWAGIVGFAVSTAVIWSSSEDDLDSLFS